MLKNPVHDLQLYRTYIMSFDKFFAEHSVWKERPQQRLAVLEACYIQCIKDILVTPKTRQSHINSE